MQIQSLLGGLKCKQGVNFHLYSKNLRFTITLNLMFKETLRSLVDSVLAKLQQKRFHLKSIEH